MTKGEWIRHNKGAAILSVTQGGPQAIAIWLKKAWEAGFDEATKQQGTSPDDQG